MQTNKALRQQCLKHSRVHRQPLRHRAPKVTRCQVDTERPSRVPDAGPAWGSPPPPPPPPPPPASANKLFSAPSRRELLFTALGAGVGVAGTAAYYNSTIVKPEEMDNVLTQVFGQVEVDNMSEMAVEAENTLQRIDAEMMAVQTELEKKDLAEDQRKALQERKDTLTAMQQEVSGFRTAIIDRRDEFAAELNKYLQGEITEQQLQEKLDAQ